MPGGGKPRSSSASGRLESKGVISLLSELGAHGKGTRNTFSHSEKADDLSAFQQEAVFEENKEQSAWLVRELLKQNKPRHSVTLGDGGQSLRPLLQGVRSTQSTEVQLLRRGMNGLFMDQETVARKQVKNLREALMQGFGPDDRPPSDLINCLVDEEITLENLQKLKLAFEEFQKQGLRRIDVKNFGHILRSCLGWPNISNGQIQGLFKKIDHSGQGKISWGEYCTYVLQEYKEKEESERRRKQMAFTLPASISDCGHGIPIINIHITHDGTVVTAREDGFVCCWTPELQPQMTKHMFNEELSNQKSKWATDFTLMLEYNKLMMGTGDREIQLYDLSTLEPYCQISALDTIPLTLDYTTLGLMNVVLCLETLKYGCVTVLLISSVEDTLRLWKRFPKTHKIPNIAIDNVVLSPNVTFVRWKVHYDWVTQARYFHSFRAVVSSSNEEPASLVVGCVLPISDLAQQLNEIREACYEGKTRKTPLSWTPQVRASCDQTVFTIYKGVKTFDLCQKHSLLVTGGMDKLIRLWNPRFSGKPLGVLNGHSAPVLFLCICSENSQIFSASTDATVKIWHIQDQCCLFTADPKAVGIHRDIFSCSYSPAMKSLYIAADCMAVLPLKLRPRLHRHSTVSHDQPVLCCSYSQEFRQVVSCCEGAVVKVWDFDSGHQVFEFGGTNDLTAITCMTMDSEGRRLITGGRDGCLKIWNFNNGQCLKTLKTDGKCREVCDCIFLKVHRNLYVMSVGRDRRIDIYSANYEDPHHVQRPPTSWQDDLVNGHKGDILCVAQCPPSFLATSSCDGEIIVWNMASQRVHCRFSSPVETEHRDPEAELDESVPCILFLQNSSLRRFPATALLSSGMRGYINLWDVLGGGKLVGKFKASKFQQKIVKMARNDNGMLLYTADRIGYIYIYDLEKFDPEKKSPRAENFWRAHTSAITGLETVDSDQVVLTSSTDRTVRLWSAKGEFIGTFGQPEIWSVHIPSSWKHPGVPYEVLIDPLSVPDRGILKGESHLSEAINPDKTEADRGELKSPDETVRNMSM
ncbi:cilia- and flagella-associated protein 337 [Menidia menidia]